MKKFPMFSLLLLAVTASLVLVACGSSDDSSDTSNNASSVAPTKAEFIKQADAICSKGNAATQDAAKAAFGTKAPSKADIADFLSTSEIPNLEQQASDLRDLTPPAGDEDTINSLLDSLDEGISNVKDDPAAAIGKTDPLADATKQAQDYGFKSCGGDS